MNEVHKKGLIKGFIAFGIWIIFTIIVASMGKDVSFRGIMLFIDFIIFIVALGLIITSWGGHLKSKLHK